MAAVGSLPADLRSSVKAIGLTYQMHGLVLLDRQGGPLRPSIIWCDSRAIAEGERARSVLGEEFCLTRLLNYPGNFTAAKMGWVARNEPGLAATAATMMLPGDYIALRLSGHAGTTASGLSEMVLWDFESRALCAEAIAACGFSPSLVPDLVPTFGLQGQVTQEAAASLGVPLGTPVTYRAGDQPNNAFCLGALLPGDVAATAGTSGVIYGVTDEPLVDRRQRVNVFLHVNHTPETPRYGILLCVNGCGSMYSYLRNTFFGTRFGYEELNDLAAQAPAGSGALSVYPFGNGAERILGNRNPGAALCKIDFNHHGASHLCRAVQEGIAFALYFGMEAGIRPSKIRAAHANLFLSPVFAQTLATLTGSEVEIRDTDGAVGAARGAAVGAGYFRTPEEASGREQVMSRYEPLDADRPALSDAYENWREGLPRVLEEVQAAR